MMKNLVNVFLIDAFLLLAFSFCSCGISTNEKTQGKESTSVVIEVTPSIIPIQRTIYDVQLGKTYTYEELVSILQKNINNLVSEKEYDILSYKPKLSVYQNNNYLSYSVFSSSNSSQQYLFGNQYWDDFDCCSTLDGRIYSIEFSSSGKGVYALAHKNQYHKLLEQLTQKYGEPNSFQNNSDTRVFWMDENTVLELCCSHKTDDDYGIISIEYRDSDIFNEVVDQQKSKGYDDL